jgi:deoxyribodipyrimidine photolyase-related protein
MDSSEQYIRRRLLQLKREFQEEGVTLEIRPNTQFIVSHEDFLEKYETPPVMETFYRWIRKRTGILMERGKPVGGKRNYDKENRKFDRDFDGVTQWE